MSGRVGVAGTMLWCGGLVRFLRRSWMGLAILGASFAASHADDSQAPTTQFYISMRAPDVDPSPRYAPASLAPADGKTADIQGCDGQTYYLSVADAAAVRAALANANTVQLQAADPGADASTSRVLCLMQSSN